LWSVEAVGGGGCRNIRLPGLPATPYHYTLLTHLTGTPYRYTLLLQPLVVSCGGCGRWRRAGGGCGQWRLWVVEVVRGVGWVGGSYLYIAAAECNATQ